MVILMAQHMIRADRYLLAIIALAVVYFTLMFFVQFLKYSDFGASYYDSGVTAYSFYQHLGGQSFPNPLQYLVFFNHMCVFCVALIPFFALNPQPMTLVLVQEAFLAFTAMAVYAVCKSLLRDRGLGLVLSFAFLINPGVMGMALFDFHQEAFIALFYVLSFYFYFKNRRGLFAVSYLLMLSVSETTDMVGAAMLLSLLLYELLHRPVVTPPARHLNAMRMQTLLLGFALTAMAFLFYSYATGYILNSYATISFASSPPITRLVNYIGLQIGAVLKSGAVSSNLLFTYTLGLTGLAILFFGFGLTSLADPLLSAVLISPWLVEVFIVRNTTFAFWGYQYYGFVVGASLLASVLGFFIFRRRKAQGPSITARSLFLPSIIILSAIGFAMSTPVLSSYILFISAGVQKDYSHLYAALSLIPPNSGVMAQASMAPHLFYVKDLELPPAAKPASVFSELNATVYWFVPGYIIADKNLSDYSDFFVGGFNLSNYTRNAYSLYYNQSGVYVYRALPGVSSS